LIDLAARVGPVVPHGAGRALATVQGEALPRYPAAFSWQSSLLIASASATVATNAIAADPNVFMNELWGRTVEVLGKNVPRTERLARFRQLFQQISTFPASPVSFSAVIGVARAGKSSKKISSSSRIM
jgi:hypothetical protein